MGGALSGVSIQEAPKPLRREAMNSARLAPDSKGLLKQCELHQEESKPGAEPRLQEAALPEERPLSPWDTAGIVSRPPSLVEICYVYCVFYFVTAVGGPHLSTFPGWLELRKLSIVRRGGQKKKLVSDGACRYKLWNGYTVQTWPNEYISWNPANYCGIEKIIIPPDNFWMPDLFIYEQEDSDSNAQVIPFYTVSYDGMISNAKPLRIKSSCNLNIYRFPFDTQLCYLSFGSYSHGVEDIVMDYTSNSSQVNQSSFDVFVGKGDWSLVSVSVFSMNVARDDVYYSQVYYEIIVKRAPVVYVINLIVPACFLVILDVSGMFIHMDTGERLVFKVTVVLGFSVLLLLLNDILPISDSAPVLGMFCCVCLAIMIFSTIGSISTSYIIMLHHTQPHVPRWIEICVKYLACVLLFNVPSCKKTKLTTEDKVVTAEVTKSKPGMTIEMKRQDLQRNNMNVTLEVKLLKTLLSEVYKIHRQFIEFKDQEGAKSRWHFVAVVVDRLILIIYIVIVIIMFAVMINAWSAPEPLLYRDP